MTRLAAVAAGTFLVAVFLGYIAVVAVVGPFGWDDGAITVAYARSLALGGEVALTLASERVEGSSTPLTVLLLALVMPVSEDAFLRQIFLSQVLTIAALGGTVAALFVMLRDTIPSVSGRLLVLALFAALPLHLTEAINGMEMVLLGLLLTLFVAADRAPPWVALLLIPLILATRFEAAFYLGVALTGLFLFDPARRRRHAGLLVALFVAFGLFTLGRWLYFGDVMPNTVWAKMRYAGGGASLWLEIRAHLAGPAEMLGVAAPFLLVAGGLWAARPDPALFRTPVIWLLLGYVIFAAVTGRNLGYEGRMFVGALPLLVLLVAEQARGGIDAARVAEGRPYPAARAVGVFVLVLLAAQLSYLDMMRVNALHTLKAAQERGLLPRAIAAPLGSRLDDFPFPANPHDFCVNGLLADDMRRRLGLERITLVAPDIGGRGLCCASDTLRVVDIALLANQELAHRGYGALPEQLRREDPELILVHAMRASASGIYELPEFTERYRGVVSGDTLFWLRADLVDALGSSPGTRLSPLPAEVAFTDLRNDLREIDLEFLEGAAPRPVLLLEADAPDLG